MIGNKELVSFGKWLLENKWNQVGNSDGIFYQQYTTPSKRVLRTMEELAEIYRFANQTTQK